MAAAGKLVPLLRIGRGQLKTGRYLCAVVSLSLTLAACSPRASASSQPLQASSPPTLGESARPANTSNTAAGTPDGNTPDDVTTGTTSPASEPENPNNAQTGGLQAALTSLEGKIEIKHVGESAFNTITDTVAVIEGDTVRTGLQSMALLIFMDNTEMTLFENSEVKVSAFARQSAGGIVIKLDQSAGYVFQRVNFGSLKTGSLYELTTPQAVTTVLGTAYWVKILPDRDVFYCVIGHVDIQPEGKPASVGCEGITVEVNGGNVTKGILDPDLFHGDGICDPYMGEDRFTSPKDCGNRNSTIHCGNKVCESSVGENANSCPIDCKP